MVAAGAVLTLAAVSCSTHRTVVYSTTSPRKIGGPPPHAPAHGYRHKHRDVELVYDSRMAVYVVNRHPQHYFDADRFYRCRANVWEVSLSIEGPWGVTTIEQLPAGLQRHARDVEKHPDKPAKVKKAKGKAKRW
jgi:hypothetical protein